MTAARTPTGLRKNAQRLWRETTKAYDLRADELRVLEDACREMDLVDAMQAEVDKPGFSLIVHGSMGQPVSNPLVQELRQHRSALQRLLASLHLPDEEGTDRTAAARSASARAAAQARWHRRGA